MFGIPITYNDSVEKLEAYLKEVNIYSSLAESYMSEAAVLIKKAEKCMLEVEYYDDCGDHESVKACKHEADEVMLDVSSTQMLAKEAHRSAAEYMSKIRDLLKNDDGVF